MEDARTRHPMRSLATLIWSTARPGLVGPGLACIGATAFVGSLCFLQESAALRRLGLEFAWGSCRDAVVAATLALGVAESIRWTPERDSWELRASRGAPFYTVQRILASLLGLSLVAGTSTLLLLTLERILVGASASGEGWSCLWQTLAIAVPLAAWTPAIGAIADRLGLSRTVLWALTIAASCGVLGLGVPLPLDRLPPLGDGDVSWWAGLLPACALSAAAGVCVTVAVVPLPQPRTSPCGSASSETSTATSRH